MKRIPKILRNKMQKANKEIIKQHHLNDYRFGYRILAVKQAPKLTFTLGLKLGDVELWF